MWCIVFSNFNSWLALIVAQSHGQKPLVITSRMKLVQSRSDAQTFNSVCFTLDD